MNKRELIPNLSYGEFILGTHITKYKNIPFEFNHYDEKTYSYDNYFFYEINVEVWVEEGIITTIRCKHECFYNGENIIGQKYSDFLKINNVEPDSEETIYLLVNDKGQNQIIYEFDKLGLQIWIWRKRIVTVLIYNSLR